MNSIRNKMFLPATQYDCEKVVRLIINNDLDMAMTYMIDYAEHANLDSLHSKLIGCSNRLQRTKKEFLEETITYETHNINLNKIIILMQHLNVKIDKLNKSVRNKTLVSILKTLIGFALLFALLYFLKPFYFDKLISSKIDVLNSEKQERQYLIEDFYITNTDCIDSTYAIIKIKNTGEKDLKNITFKWIPDIQVSNHFLTGVIEDLPVNKTGDIKILLKNRNQYAPGVYRSSLEEFHPIPAITKIYQYYEIEACKKVAVKGNTQMGDSVKVSYLEQYENRLLLTTDSISLPVNFTSFKIKKL